MKWIVVGTVVFVLGCAVTAALRLSPPPDLVFQQVREGDHAAIGASLRADARVVGCRDSFGYTPLHWAAAMSDRRATDLLLAAGADPNARDIRGRTPLHVAAMSQHRSEGGLMKSLIARGALVDATDERGATPLQLARTVNRTDLAEALVAAGAAPVEAADTRLALGGGPETAVAPRAADPDGRRASARTTRIVRRWAWRAAGGPLTWVRLNRLRSDADATRRDG